MRRDLADIALADQVFAQHYAEPMTMRASTTTPVRVAPSEDAAVVKSLTEGDSFAVLELGDGWSWGRCCDGGCVGYVATATLAYP